MDAQRLHTLLESVRSGSVGVDEALRDLQHLPFESTEFAHIDHHRSLRRGFTEVIYCPGKTADQTATIFSKLAAGGGNVLATRATQEQFDAITAMTPGAQLHATARCVTLRQKQNSPSVGVIALVTAGTSDLPVIEEARVTCEIMDQSTRVICDVGVAGIHRLLAHAPTLREARVIVVAAGMEGALPGVVAGLVTAPVIAVPTSVGYGANIGGISTLFSMLNSCATGLAVVNIDNGFAAGYLAATINRIGEKST